MMMRDGDLFFGATLYVTQICKHSTVPNKTANAPKKPAFLRNCNWVNTRSMFGGFPLRLLRFRKVALRYGKNAT